MRLNKFLSASGVASRRKADELIEPKWLVKKFCVLNDIDKELKRRNTYQGYRLEKND